MGNVSIEKVVGRLQQDPLFVALTRVPTVLGVPYFAFVLELMAASMLNVVSGNPLYSLLVVPVHGVFYLISLKDPGVFSEIEIWMKTAGRCLNRRFWGAASFSPLVTHKWRF